MRRVVDPIAGTQLVRLALARQLQRAGQDEAEFLAEVWERSFVSAFTRQVARVERREGTVIDLAGEHRVNLAGGRLDPELVVVAGSNQAVAVASPCLRSPPTSCGDGEHDAGWAADREHRGRDGLRVTK